MTYTGKIETMDGTVLVSCTDEQIDALPENSTARILRDDYRSGVYVSHSEIAGTYWGEM